MKKIILITISLFLGSNVFAGQESKINIAVAEFGSRDVSAMDANSISDFFRTEMVNTNLFNVLERSNMEKILEEQQFQLTGCTEQECAVQMGKLLNVEKIIIGTVSKFDLYYYITARVIDIETGEITVSEKIRSKKKKSLPDKSEQLASYISKLLTGKKPQKREWLQEKDIVYLNLSIGNYAISDIEYSQRYARFLLGYSFTEKLSAIFSCNLPISNNEDPYLKVTRAVTYYGAGGPSAEFNEVIKSLTMLSVGCEYKYKLLDKLSSYINVNPAYYIVKAEQYVLSPENISFGTSLGLYVPSGKVEIPQYGYGYNGSIGIKYSITRQFSIGIQYNYHNFSIKRETDFTAMGGGISETNELLEPDFDDLGKSHNVAGYSYSVGANIKF